MLNSRFSRLCALVLALAGTTPPAAAQIARIENTASLSYGGGDAAVIVRSNTVALDVDTAKRPTRLSFRLPPPGFGLAGARCETVPGIQFHPAPIDAEALAAAPHLATLDVAQPIIIVLDNPAGNHDPDVRESVSINVDTDDVHATLPLLETAPASGIFAGGVPAATDTSDPALAPCSLRLDRGERLRLSIAESDNSLASEASMLVDPAGFVFDSRTGVLVDGAVVTLLDAAGQPAIVYGDDGASRYPSTVTTGASVTDASGRIYPAVTGRYRFPFAAPGQYTIRVSPPGDYIAPSVASRDALAALRGPGGTPFVVVDASFGGALTLAGSDAIYADIPVDRPGKDALLVTKLASVRQASPGDAVQYRIHLSNRDVVAARDLHLADSLPAGLRYQRGSTRGTGEPQLSGDGRSLDFALAPLAPGASVELSYLVSVAPGAPVGEAVNRVRARGAGGASSNEAAAAVRLQPLLFTDALTVLGRVTEGGCDDPASGRKGVAGIRLLLEDGSFVLTDRDGLFHFEGVRAGRHVVQLDTASLPGTHEPVACDTDTRQAGSATSRFVEGSGGLVRRVDFQLRATGNAAAAADALPIAVLDDAAAAGNRDWLQGQQPGIAWLFPQADHNPRTPTVRVAIKHRPGQRVALSLNGSPVDSLAFDTTDVNGDAGVAVSRWSGIALTPGDNRLTARILSDDGVLVEALERVVHVSGAPARVAIDLPHSRLLADGRQRPLIAVRVTDAAGRPVRAGTLVPFRVDQPYRAAIDPALEQGRQLAGRDRAGAEAQVVGDDGFAFLPFQPTTQAGAVRAHVTTADGKVTRTSALRAWLAAPTQNWTVVGFGAGSVGYETLSRHGRSLPVAERGGALTDGQLALYAKGRIKGEWLLTLAYDSKRRYDADRGLLGVIDPDRYYTVYGDGSAQAQDAASARKLYLRLERREALALFGDFETGQTDALLTRYSRTLTGAKAAYEGEPLRAAGFVATTDQRHLRDEIRGNGLSGPYRLSARAIVPNSDQLSIEVRDRFRPERILSSTPMTRHIDYDIDPALGTIRFRQPVLGRDASRNPQVIVVDYEVEAGRSGKLVAGGRVAARTANGALEVGIGAIRDDTLGHATVLGADLTARLAPTTDVRGEVAAGGQGGLHAGRAFLAEAEHHGGGIDLLAYARQQDSGFGVGQQNVTEAGTRKLGIDGRLALSDQLSLAGTAWHQQMLGSAATRTAADLRLELRRAAGTLFVGGQLARERGLDGTDRDSRLLTLGGSQSLFDGRLTLAGQTQVAPGGNKASSDFPVRHQVSAAWRLTPAVRVIAGYEIADGRDRLTHTAQIGFDVAPWAGAKLTGALGQQEAGENPARTYAQYGLAQSLPIGTRWTVDATLDATATVRGQVLPGTGTASFRPAAATDGLPGQDAAGANYTAVTLGAGYRANRWSWTGRIEYRDADTGQRWGITSNALRALGGGQTIAAGLRAYSLTDRTGAAATYATADLALALRPLDSRWTLLERFSLRHERADAGFSDANPLGVPAGGAGEQVTTRAINNLALSFRSGAEGQGHGLEATAYYGAKYVQGRFAKDRFTGFVDVVGFDLRRDVGRRFDIGIAGSIQHGWTAGAWAWSGGPSLGVSPAGDLWISAGWNVAGYRDRDFEDDRYTRSGPYLTVRMKFDGRLFTGAARASKGGL